MTGQHVGRLPAALPGDKYVCGRCGITASCNSSRKKPTRCPDCRDIECLQGHLWPEEPKRDSRGVRICVTCTAETKARYQQRRKEAA